MAYPDGMVKYIKNELKRCLARKEKMQAYQHIKANANGGAITLASTRPHEKFVVLGSSCLSSVTKGDGLVNCVTVIPENLHEVIAIAVVVANDPEFLVTEALLLGITTKDSKPFVDLQVPFGGCAKIMGQLIQTGNTCQLRVVTKGQTLLSIPWSSASLKPSTETASTTALGESFDSLCKQLVAALNPGPEVLDVQLLTAAFTPDVVVKAAAVGPIEQVLSAFHRLIQVCPGQGVAYDNQVLSATWHNNRWEVSHPCC